MHMHGVKECAADDECGGGCAVMDMVKEEWRWDLVPDADHKGFNLKKYATWFHVGSTVDDDGHHDV